jgi:hypothetical protein
MQWFEVVTVESRPVSMSLFVLSGSDVPRNLPFMNLKVWVGLAAAEIPVL